MTTVNFGQSTIIGMVYDQALCHMDWNVSYLRYPGLWSHYCVTPNYMLAEKKRKKGTVN